MQFSFQEYHLFQILRGFDNQHLPLDLFLNHYFRAHKALGSKDRRFIAEAVYGMTRWRSLLDYLTGQPSSWKSRYAVFQGFQPANYLYVNSIPPHIRVSFPQALFELLVAQYGEERALHLCSTSNTEAPTTVRINPAKTTRDAMIAIWEKEYDISPCVHAPYGIHFKRRFNFSELSAFKEGLFEVQDEGSQCLGELVDAKPGDQVLDYCSGSGGKTLAFAHKLEGKGQIYLHDIRPYALQQARKRLQRAGIQNAQMLTPKHPQLDKLKKRIDWVLVDAPCSGTGTLRRNPDMKWKFSTEMIERLIGQQRMIFERALSFLAPGGKIVYATCSLLRQENEEQLHHFLRTYDLKMASDPFVSLPTFGGSDGFFGVVLERFS